MEIIKLPKPIYKGKVSLEEAIYLRRSVRSYRAEPLTLPEVSQLLWSASGLSHAPYRVVPSAGATYPLELYLAVGNIEGMAPGLYHYQVDSHSLLKKKEEDLRERLCEAALGQDMVLEAAINIVICAEPQRTTRRYGERGTRYIHMEAGHVGQNLALQAVTLGLGTVMVGAFRDKELKSILGCSEEPLYVVPIGRI